MVKDKLYHTLETLCFTFGLVSGSLVYKDLPTTINLAKDVYNTNTKDKNKNKVKSKLSLLNASKQYSIPETCLTLGLLGTGYIIRSKRKGKSHIGPLEIGCLAGALSVGYFGSNDIRQLRNVSAALGVLPVDTHYTKEDLEKARETVQDDIAYSGLETYVIATLIYRATRKKED